MISKAAIPSFNRLLRSRPSAAIVSTLPRRDYTRMTTEQYLLNARNAIPNTLIQTKQLSPLLEANHTTDTRTVLYGVPKIPKSTGGQQHV